MPGNRSHYSCCERFDQILCDANAISSRLRVLHFGHVHQQGPRPVHGEHQGGVAMRAPAPRLVRDKGLVGVEAGEVVDVGVVILGGTPAGPGDEGGEAALLGELTGGSLASFVFGVLDPHGCPYFRFSCRVVLADDAALPPSWWLSAWWSIAASERGYERHDSSRDGHFAWGL